MSVLQKGAKKAKDAKSGIKRMLTEFEKAMEEAQRNAALPIEQGGLGLPPDNTALDRAKALGYDLTRPLFHGSLHDIKNVDVDRSSVGGHAGRGFYTTPDPEDASMNYADWKGPDQTSKLQNELERIAEDKDISRISSMIYGSGKYKDVEPSPRRMEKILRGTGTGENLGTVYPVFIRHGDEANAAEPRRSAFLEPGEIYDPETDEYIEGPAMGQWMTIFNRLRNMGVEPTDELYQMMGEGARYDEIWDAIRKSRPEAYDDYTGDMYSAGGVATEVLRDIGANTITHPTQFGNPDLNIAGSHTIALQPSGIVRSKWAAFDPMKRNSSNILAGAGAGVATMVGSRQPSEEERRQSAIDKMVRQMAYGEGWQ